ncbi:hypothetical protein OG564_17745 [Streptomyces sp. NBC_01280]|uniref:hypothetical protein n=1 Tax=Streptomyces sp. NBC_01280 TaxID=2903810 RepID=UPI002E36087B|nr:hypothetical protein [Streptomyces sp. NBC_01280]
MTILPQGTGVLTRHITVTGTNPADGTAVKQEVYVDGHSGFPVMQYSGIQTFGATGAAASGSANGAATTPGDASTTAVPPFLVKGSGTRYNGRKVDLNLYKGSDGTYQMYDYGLARSPASAIRRSLTTASSGSRTATAPTPVRPP